MDNLTPVIVGALIAVAGGLVGAFYQAYREHKKWLRERRYDAYVVADAALTRMEVLIKQSREQPERAAEHLATRDEIVEKELPAAFAHLNMVGTERVIAAKDGYLKAMESDDPKVVRLASDRFINAMRRALGISLWR